MRVFCHVLLPCLFLRIQKATESLRTFHPSADPCFDEFVLDTSREETLLKEMCFGGGTTDLFFNLNVVRWEWKHKASRKTTVTFLKTKQKSYLCLNPAVVACFQAVLWPPVFKGVSVLIHCSTAVFPHVTSHRRDSVLKDKLQRELDPKRLERVTVTSCQRDMMTWVWHWRRSLFMYSLDHEKNRL